MQDAFAYCADLVRTADRDRFLARCLRRREHRGALFALYAFNIEMTRVREAAREPLPGEIRLQWWNEVLGGERREEASANPVAAALLKTIERHRLPTGKLIDLIEARRFDLYDEPMAGHCRSGNLCEENIFGVIALAAQILGVDAQPAADPAGIAYGIAGLMRAFPLHAARHQLYVPVDLLEGHGVDPSQIFAGQSSAGLNAAFAELRKLGRHHLAAAHERVRALPRAAHPAFLPVTLVRPWLDRMDRS